MERSDGYATVPNPWLDAMARAGCSGTEFAVVCELCTYIHWEGPRPYGSFSHKAVCDRYGWSPNRVKKAARHLRALGFLATKTAAHNGRCTESWLFPGIPWQRPTKDKGRKGPDLSAVDWGHGKRGRR